MLATAAQAASAQQLPNTTFDDAWVDCFPWEAGSYVSTARGSQPEGWCISNVSNVMMPIVGEEVEPGADGTGKAVKLINVTASIAGQNAPGYMTLGTAWATAETKMTSVRNADGGVFGGIEFNYHPDAVRLTYKHDVSNGAENMSVIAYLWKGTWTQMDVPSNTAVGVFSWAEATKVTMFDRIQNVLGRECLTGGDVFKTDDAALIASVEYYNNEGQEEWTTLELPFNYGEYAGQPVDVEKLNIVIASNGMFDDKDSIRSGNSVTIDDVELVYWHSLSALSFEGAALDFSEETTYYDLSSVDYDAEKLAYAVKGQAATASMSFDEDDRVLTIRVEGEDIAFNPNAFTEYKILFKSDKIVKLIPNVIAERTELTVDEQTTLTLENCDGLVAEYSAPGIISYEDGVVTAVGGGTVTLILTQPETETIEAKVFEIEFTVNKKDAEWAWNIEDNRYYYPNTVVENAVQLIVGEASHISYSSTSSTIAKVNRDGTLTLGERTGVATITVRYRGDTKWNASNQQYVVKVAEPGHVPFELTHDLYELIKNNISGGQGWDENGGIRVGKNTEIFSWGNKDFYLEISGIPDKLSFTYSSSSGASGRDYRIFESADGQDYKEIWRDNRGSGVDGNSYQSGDIQLSRDTRFIKFHYYGNCAGYFREIRVTELHKFECDTQEMHLNETVRTGSFTFTHANAGKITVTAPQAITLSPARITGGMDIYGEEVVNVSYNLDDWNVDDDIVITDGKNTTKIHVVARVEDPDAIHSPIEETEEKETDIYNLAGQRITKMQKGINIVNGKKVLK